MAAQTQMVDKHISAANAATNARNAKAAQAVGNETTSRGTVIRKSNTEFDKNSFLKILAAQLSNLDPTQNQDSSAYVAQMAQFTSMEQTANLNDTMSNSANQQLVGKTVILDEKYSDGSYVKGNVTDVIKKTSGTFLTVVIDGKKEEIPIKKIIGVSGAEDGNMTANIRTALNSDFIAASALASKKQNVIVADVDKDNKAIPIKGKVSGAYIDTIDGGIVKIKVDVVDADGKSTNKTYKYQEIISAGDLTEDDMNATMESIKKALKAQEDADAKAAAEKAALEKAAAEKAAADKLAAEASTPTSAATGA